MLLRGWASEPPGGGGSGAVLLVLCDYFLPGYKGGGALRTVVNMIDLLQSEFRCRVVCRDRDQGDDRPYAGVVEGRWQRVGGADVCYLAPRHLRARALRDVILQADPDLIYL